MSAMAAATNVDIQSVEAPFVKVVQECLVKTFKGHKKFLEKELSTLVNKVT
jgi:hypothetical protein